MASSSSSKPKPLMLKDFLRDDLNTSSSGFRTLPRTAETTMRCLLEVEYQNSRERLLKTGSRRTLTKISAVLNAVRTLPFSVSSSPKHRSFSIKLLRRSFWKKLGGRGGGSGGCQRTEVAQQTNKKVLIRDIVRLSSFPDESRCGKVKRSVDVVQLNRCSCSSSSGWSVSCSLSSPGSDSLPSSASPASSESTRSEKVTHTTAVNGDSIATTNCNRAPKEKGMGGEAVIVGCTCHELEEKEQLSPVSVMDFPYEDEEEEEHAASTPASFHNTIKVDRSKHHLLQKIQRFENLSHLVDPINLDEAFLAEVEEEEQQEEVEVGEEEARARVLLQLLIDNGCFAGKQNGIVEEFLLLDFLIDGLLKSRWGANRDTWRDNTATTNDRTVEERLLTAAEEWVNGSAQVVGVDRGNGGELQIEEMERNGRWRCFNEEEDEVAMDVENRMLGSLIDELLLDMINV